MSRAGLTSTGDPARRVTPFVESLIFGDALEGRRDAAEAGQILPAMTDSFPELEQQFL